MRPHHTHGETLRTAVVLMLVWTGVPIAAQAAQFTNPIRGYKLTYPGAWNANVNPDDGTLILRSYPVEQARRMADPPRDRAMILVFSYPPYDNPGIPQGIDDHTALDNIMHGDEVVSREDASSGKPARVTAIAANGERYVNTMTHRGEKAFRVLLICWPDDPRISVYEQVLDDVVGSITVVSGTPAPPTP